MAIPSLCITDLPINPIWIELKYSENMYGKRMVAVGVNNGLSVTEYISTFNFQFNKKINIYFKRIVKEEHQSHDHIYIKVY